ncbi:MAG: hypothetical protein SFT91_02355 [Rickettsiaceae bacterium]|nr:hypothetical protein [Rickettsiaceae bacterium]
MRKKSWIPLFTKATEVFTGITGGPYIITIASYNNRREEQGTLNARLETSNNVGL